MAIELTKTQQDSVNYDAGDLLVKGVAGSGKSVVLMQRALRFNFKAVETGETKRIIILTFANSLVKYTNELIDLSKLPRPMIEIMTSDKLCREVYTKMTHTYRPYIIQKADQKHMYIDSAIQKHLENHEKHRFHDIDASFWAEEFKWMKEKHITSESQYVNAERTGRGGKVRMTKADKVVAYQLFQEYCSQLKKKQLLEWEDLYAYIIENAASIPEEAKYDYILVDEAQDLSYVKLKVAKLLTKRTITIAADNAQKIYGTSFSWKELGIDIRGKASKSLDKTFRSTKQIVQLAESLLEVNRAQQLDQSEYTDAVIPSREGSIPQIIQCRSAAAEQDVIAKLIKHHTEHEDTIGILYRSQRELNIIIRWLKNAPYQIISKKTEWTLTTPGVKLCTLHSSKGLEFDVIIIPCFANGILPQASLLSSADQEQIAEIKAQERSLLYVGMTRAKYDLYMTYTGAPSEFITDFDPDYYKYLSNDGVLLPKPKRLFASKSKASIVTSAPTVFDKKTNTASVPKIRDGCKIDAHNQGQKNKRTFFINTHNFPMQQVFINKTVGDTVSFRNEILVIDKIL